ncbi:MAG: response regulator [Pseudomonadota bacterium]
MTQTEKPSKILIVDDVPGNIKALAEILREKYQIILATNGRDALETTASEQPDLILLDVVMPEMDGYTVCEKLKANQETQKIPVVFVTSNTHPEQVIRGIEAGAFYYLTKPVDTKILLAVVKAALADRVHPYALQMATSQSVITALQFMEEGHFRIRTLEDALTLSRLLSEMCPDPEKSAIGLMELVINAIEHGSLGITYAEKTCLIKNDQWRDEVERRLASPECQDKYVIVRFQRKYHEIHFLIKDEGSGFDWRSYLVFDPSRAFDPNGRGIAMAKMTSFDRLEYHGVGNEVLAVVSVASS